MVLLFASFDWNFLSLKFARVLITAWIQFHTNWNKSSVCVDAFRSLGVLNSITKGKPIYKIFISRSRHILSLILCFCLSCSLLQALYHSPPPSDFYSFNLLFACPWLFSVVFFIHIQRTLSLIRFSEPAIFEQKAISAGVLINFKNSWEIE